LGTKDSPFGPYFCLDSDAWELDKPERSETPKCFSTSAGERRKEVSMDDYRDRIVDQDRGSKKKQKERRGMRRGGSWSGEIKTWN
jgi:hypothetical protein